MAQYAKRVGFRSELSAERHVKNLLQSRRRILLVPANSQGTLSETIECDARSRIDPLRKTQTVVGHKVGGTTKFESRSNVRIDGLDAVAPNLGLAGND